MKSMRFYFSSSISSCYYACRVLIARKFKRRWTKFNLQKVSAFLIEIAIIIVSTCVQLASVMLCIIWNRNFATFCIRALMRYEWVREGILYIWRRYCLAWILRLSYALSSCEGEREEDWLYLKIYCSYVNADNGLWGRIFGRKSTPRDSTCGGGMRYSINEIYFYLLILPACPIQASQFFY